MLIEKYFFLEIKAPFLECFMRQLHTISERLLSHHISDIIHTVKECKFLFRNFASESF